MHKVRKKCESSPFSPPIWFFLFLSSPTHYSLRGSSVPQKAPVLLRCAYALSDVSFQKKKKKSSSIFLIFLL